MSIEYDYHHLHHVKEQSKSRKTLWVTLILTAFFTIVEIVGGVPQFPCFCYPTLLI